MKQHFEGYGPARDYAQIESKKTQKELFVDGLRTLAGAMKTDPALSDTRYLFWSAIGMDESVWKTDYSVEPEKPSFASSLGFMVGDFDFPSEEDAKQGAGIEYNDEDCSISRERFLDLFGN